VHTYCHSLTQGLMSQFCKSQNVPSYHCPVIGSGRIVIVPEIVMGLKSIELRLQGIVLFMHVRLVVDSLCRHSVQRSACHLRHPTGKSVYRLGLLTNNESGNRLKHSSAKQLSKVMCCFHRRGKLFLKCRTYSKKLSHFHSTDHF